MTRIIAFCTALVAATGAAAQDRWEYRLTPYVWGPSFDITAGLPDGTDTSASGDVLDFLAAAFLIAGEARRGPISVFGEFNYLNLSDELAFPASTRFRRVRLEGGFGSIAVGYAFLDRAGSRLEAFAGARIWDIETRLEGPLFAPSTDLDFTDPIIGLRGETRLSERWGLRGTLDIGGFGLSDSSDFQSEVVLAASYDFSERTAGVLGYRYLYVDLPGGPGLSVDDLAFFGPFVALDFRF